MKSRATTSPIPRARMPAQIAISSLIFKLNIFYELHPYDILPSVISTSVWPVVKAGFYVPWLPTW
jgi:hypothetical protein